MKVYVSIISHFDGMLQDQETVRSFNVYMEQDYVLGIELVADEKKRLKLIVNEIATAYFDTESKRRKTLQAEIYELQKGQLDSLKKEVENVEAAVNLAKVTFDEFELSRAIDDTKLLKKEIDQLQSALSELRTLYTEEHPHIKEMAGVLSQKVKYFSIF